MKKQVVYFYEGETEKKLLECLKNAKQIIPGKLKKFNLWNGRFKSIEKTFNKTYKLLFVIDTDDLQNTDAFKKNIESLKLRNAHRFCIIYQCRNLEDELLCSCNIKDHKALFNSFYCVENLHKFKTEFAQDKNLSQTLKKNNFNLNHLWVRRSGDFYNWLKSNHITFDICREYKKSI